MEKTITVKFPDNFKFPEQFDLPTGACYDCPLYANDSEGYGICFLKSEDQGYDHDCPFKDGAENLLLNETRKQK